LFLKSPPELILASTSSYRRALLSRVYDTFECIAPRVKEERLEHEPGLALVTRLALAKARSVAERHPEAWVIGSDQAGVLMDSAQQQVILGKPGNAARALDDPTIERYVLRESPLDCAGGLKSEAAGIALCASIDSDDPTALIGLPLIRLCEILRRVGFEIP
jgi:septum formation protein